VSGSDKSYRATIRLGESTVTDDADGTVTGGAPADHLSDLDIRTALAEFVGDIDQVPSAVSAVKIGGQRAYRRVRAGEEVALTPRRVRVSVLTATAVRPEPGGRVAVEIEVTCSSGTYIRAVARDLGLRLAVGGHLTALRRTAVGGFTLVEALSLDALEARAPDVVTVPLSLAADRILVRRDVSAAEAGTLGHGGPLPPAGIPGPYAVFGPDGQVVGIVVERDGRARSEVVFGPAL
jgi:tRNA pseudouridine55 synthase